MRVTPEARWFAARGLSGFLVTARRWIRILSGIFILPWALPSVPVIVSVRFMLKPEWGVIDTTTFKLSRLDDATLALSFSMLMTGRAIVRDLKALPFVVMQDGIVEQNGTPLESFDRPGKMFVAQVSGSSSLRVASGTVKGGAAEALSARSPVRYGIGPTDLAWAADGIPARTAARPDDQLQLSVVSDKAHGFDGATDKRLS